jgi:hypothetical protein
MAVASGKARTMLLLLLLLLPGCCCRAGQGHGSLNRLHGEAAVAAGGPCCWREAQKPLLLLLLLLRGDLHCRRVRVAVRALLLLHVLLLLLGQDQARLLPAVGHHALRPLPPCLRMRLGQRRQRVRLQQDAARGRLLLQPLLLAHPTHAQRGMPRHVHALLQL